MYPFPAIATLLGRCLYHFRAERAPPCLFRFSGHLGHGPALRAHCWLAHYVRGHLQVASTAPTIESNGSHFTRFPLRRSISLSGHSYLAGTGKHGHSYVKNVPHWGHWNFLGTSRNNNPSPAVKTAVIIATGITQPGHFFCMKPWYWHARHISFPGTPACIDISHFLFSGHLDCQSWKVPHCGHLRFLMNKKNNPKGKNTIARITTHIGDFFCM